MSRLLMRRVVAGFVLSLLLMAPASAFAGWTRFSSHHFLFIGDVSQNDLKRAAGRLELFRDTISRIFPAGSATRTEAMPRIPTVVLVFKNDRSFAPFRPEYEGRAVQVAGYATSSEDTNYIAVNASQEADAYGIIFHEFAHLYLRDAIGEVPLWLNEGLAEFYETFETARDGHEVVLGKAAKDNVDAFTTALLPLSLAQLVAVTPDSPLYNEGERRGLFYAQSWALVHYLMFGGPERIGQLQQLLLATSRGLSASDAMVQVFGDDLETIERELDLYGHRRWFKAERMAANGDVVGNRVHKGEPLPDAEAAAYLGDAIAHLGRIDDARAFLQAAIERGRAPRTIAALGLLEMREGRLDVGQALLERAIAQAPELAAAQRWYARALLRRAEGADAEPTALYADARLALEWSLELEPGHPTALVGLARASLGLGDAERAVTLLQSLVVLSPQREDYRLMLAESLLARRDYDAAMQYLGPLLARGRSPQTREAAREMLGRVVAARGAE